MLKFVGYQTFVVIRCLFVRIVVELHGDRVTLVSLCEATSGEDGL